MATDPIVLPGGIQIPADEVEVTFSRSSGPGGQHVNKTETRVTLRFPLETSPSIPEAPKARMVERLAPRLTKAGELLVSSDAHRERTRNLEDAWARLAELLRASLFVPKARKKTKPSKRAKARRMNDKKAVADKKKRRRPPGDD